MATGGLCIAMFVLLVNVYMAPAGLDGLWSLAYSLGEYLGKFRWVTQRRDLAVEPKYEKRCDIVLMNQLVAWLTLIMSQEEK